MLYVSYLKGISAREPKSFLGECQSIGNAPMSGYWMSWHIWGCVTNHAKKPSLCESPLEGTEYGVLESGAMYLYVGTWQVSRGR